MKKSLLALALMSLSSIANTFAQNDIKTYNELRTVTSKNENIDTFATIYSANVILGFNQNLLHNWAAGGELLSTNVNGVFNGSIIKYNGNQIWTNNLDMAYGLLYAYSNRFVPRKTDDRIDFTSKYGYRLKTDKDFYFTVLLNAKSQFTKGYNYDVPFWTENPTSGFLSPLYVTAAPGIEYRKGSQFSLFYSPAAMRMTFASKKYTELTEAGNFGIPYKKNFRFEIGSYLTMRYTKDITTGLTYIGRFDLYSNYLAKDRYLENVLVQKDNPGNIDILWDNVLTYKFMKYFSANIGFLAIYDNDIPYVRNPDDPTKGLGWWQLKQFFGLGFNYKF